MNLPLPLSSDKRYIEALCYMSQISQAMGIKTQSEVYRVHRDLEANTMGALYWQLNDVWIAPSWSSIDFFGVPKILWYWSKDFFAPIAIIAQLDNDLNQINVTISREERSMEDFNGFVEMKLYKYGSFQPEKEFRWEVVVVKVRQNTQRIIHHPSIAIIATNNENEMAIAGHWWPIEEQYFDEYRQLYVKTVRDEIYNVIKTDNIEVLVSSPSNGILSEQENYLSNKPNDNQYGDIHFYDITINIWNPLKFPNPRFSSEYGTQSIPPMRSWSLILDSNDSISDLMDHRQHSPLRMEVILPQLKMNLPLPLSSDKRYIEALCYMSQISQAMGIKTQSEVYRVHRDLEANTMGALYWQLND
uniref:Beta-mannosidase n=1 Tax=Megaselia scalaris TaxID=36166 RepID=T1GYJ2_MEGSC